MVARENIVKLKGVLTTAKQSNSVIVTELQEKYYFVNMRAAKVTLKKVVYALNIHQVGIESAKLKAVTKLYEQVECVVDMHHVVKLKGALTKR